MPAVRLVGHSHRHPLRYLQQFVVILVAVPFRKVDGPQLMQVAVAQVADFVPPRRGWNVHQEPPEPVVQQLLPPAVLDRAVEVGMLGQLFVAGNSPWQIGELGLEESQVHRVDSERAPKLGFERLPMTPGPKAHRATLPREAEAEHNVAQ
jgi:hypothetical protein